MKITSPVGKTSGNKRNDVLAVQASLNRHMKCKMGYLPVKEDGYINARTLDAIRAFQEMVGILPVDSTVFPGGPTHQALDKPSIRILNPTAACWIANQEKIRQALIDRLSIVDRLSWKAQNPAMIPPNDWNYHSIAIHHAGNTFGCAAPGMESIRQVEKIDIKKFGRVSYHYAVACDGTIYEALDIRHKGAHVEAMNTGVIGIVLLADLSVRGEGAKYGPGVMNVAKAKGAQAAINEFLSVQADRLKVLHDEGTEQQISRTEALVGALKDFFPIRRLGGHRDFAKTVQTSRACPGIYGMIIADQLRKKLGLSEP
ncbi:N-acetylmuramoyl-L-alanine amidase [Acidovorax sp. SUPP3434]|uniref:peptidoglycan recognition protein family protein n=1 Tax=Acidovorax sp. SUPP3434 TaxID=2920880 RepID=UPI0023DE2A10|nr:N-acetylmuramoyl-L-alanine amidase [Acidovorax sp. SUPP3434]GKT00879.1 N-acetylmuramoyl-L-alanine amidase [Acidovorax sp. SUPP3434]